MRDLRELSASLGDELVTLINKDYKDFVSLSANLVGIDSVVDEVSEPLQRVRAELSALRAALAVEARAVDEKLRERRELAKKRRRLELAVALLRAVARVETLLQVEQATSFGGELDVGHLRLTNDDATATLIERVAAQFNQLRYLRAAAGDMPLLRALTPRIDVVGRTLHGALDSLFRAALLAPNTADTNNNDNTGNNNNKNNNDTNNTNDNTTSSADTASSQSTTIFDIELARNCLRTYAAIGHARDAERLVRELVVRPGVRRAVTREALEAGVRGSCKGLGSICARVLQHIDSACAPLLDMTMPPRCSHARLTTSSSSNTAVLIHGYDFLTNAIWPEIQEAFVAELSHIFRP